MLEFCAICENMLYIQLIKTKGGDNVLINYCNSCGWNKELSKDRSLKLLEINHSDTQKNYKMFENPWIKYDPTLPRVKNIECPNEGCTKPKEEDNEVIYIKYDGVNMKFLYHCVYCSHFWRIENSAD